jgi:hypothetical protein
MKPIVWMLGGIAGLWLLTKKQSETFNKATEDIYIPPAVTPTVKPVIKTKVVDTAPLSVAENDLLNGGTHQQIYNAAMSSKNLAFVTMAANQLAEEGDTSAMDLTMRIANWNA